MIKVKNLVFEYSGDTALNNISFEIKHNTITALVGPNGAGKTTLLRCIAALEDPFDGSILVNDINTFENPRKVHRYIGYLSDSFGLYSDLTVRQCLTYMAGINNVGYSSIKKRVKEVAEELQLLDYLDKLAGSLSKGLGQRLGIAQAIIHKPKVLLLDEPASGLDPEARISLSKLLLSLKKQGMTIMVSSHILSELEEYCTDMLIIKKGVIIKQVDVSNANSAHEEHSVEVKFLDDSHKYKSLFQEIENAKNIKIADKCINFQYSGKQEYLSKVLKELANKNIPISSFSVHKKRLQDIYMNYMHGEDDK